MVGRWEVEKKTLHDRDAILIFGDEKLPKWVTSYIDRQCEYGHFGVVVNIDEAFISDAYGVMKKINKPGYRKPIKDFFKFGK